MTDKQINFFSNLRIALIMGLGLVLILHIVNYFNTRAIDGSDFISAAIILLSLVYLIFNKPKSGTGPTLA